MNVLSILPTNTVNVVRQGLKLAPKTLPDTVSISQSTKINVPKNKLECIKYAKIYINGRTEKCNMQLKWLDSLIAFHCGISTPSSKIRIIKDKDNEVIGGFCHSINESKEMSISDFAISKKRGTMTTKKNAEALKLALGDMSNLVSKNHAEKIVIFVKKDSPELVKLYKRAGFKIDLGEFDDKVRMSVSSREFLANTR